MRMQITGKEKSTLHKRLDCTRKCSYYRTPPSQRKSSLRDLKYVVEEEKRRRGLQSDFPKRKRNFIRYRLQIVILLLDILALYVKSLRR